MKEYISRLINDYEFEISGKSSMGYDEFEESLKTIFKKYFDKDYVEDNFSIPLDLKDFVEALEGSLWQDYWRGLYCKEGIVMATEGYCETWGEEVIERRKLNKSYPNDKMWLCVGMWSDKHDYIMSCDKSSKHFGKFYDVLDDHLWIGETFYNDKEYDGILDFLYREYLENMEIRGVHIKEVPSEIYEIKYLKGLSISYTGIASIDDRIGELSNLECLSLEYTNVKSIPKTIGNCKKLKFIYMSNTEIETLPESIKNCTNLEKIFCDSEKKKYIREILDSYGMEHVEIKEERNW